MIANDRIVFHDCPSVHYTIFPDHGTSIDNRSMHYDRASTDRDMPGDVGTRGNDHREAKPGCARGGK